MYRTATRTVFSFLGCLTSAATDVDLGDLAVGGNGLGSAQAGRDVDQADLAALMAVYNQACPD